MRECGTAAAVVELQDDEGQSVSLRHLLVVVQRPDCLYLNLAVEGVVCGNFPQTRSGERVQSENEINYSSDPTGAISPDV